MFSSAARLNSGDVETPVGKFARAMTDGTGAYELTLDPGKYIVVETTQGDWFESPDAGTTQVNASALGGFGEWGYAIELESGDARHGRRRDR